MELAIAQSQRDVEKLQDDDGERKSHEMTACPESPTAPSWRGVEAADASGSKAQCPSDAPVLREDFEEEGAHQPPPTTQPAKVRVDIDELQAKAGWSVNVTEAHWHGYEAQPSGVLNVERLPGEPGASVLFEGFKILEAHQPHLPIEA